MAKNKSVLFKCLCFLVAGVTQLAPRSFSQQPDPPGQVKHGPAQFAAYLFAHVTDDDYGRLHYTVSTNGLYWTLLNKGKRISEEYQGHPDICKGHDGRYYLVGNNSDEAPIINFWVSDDLIHWTKYSDYTPDLTGISDYPNPLHRIGAPKIFYDSSTSQYLLSWHTPHLEGTIDDPERYWASQRTLCVTSKDLKDFPPVPKRLFGWDMGTIDVIVRHVGDRYYAILKDERYPTPEWVTGKTVRISSAANLLGPYTYPSLPLSPNFREAPALIPSPDGKDWYLYYEQYPAVSYGLSVSPSLDGPWYQISGNTRIPSWNKYQLPPGVRHGCMLPISRERYEALTAAFGQDDLPSSTRRN
jgi:hypothetical protein